MRKLLLRAGDTLTDAALTRLQRTFHHDDPTGEFGAAWGVKDHVRMLLQVGSLADAHDAKMRLGAAVLVADMAETTRLLDSICTWWERIEVLIITGATNARTETANTTIKHTGRTGRGFRNEANYRSRILLTSAARAAA